jgi:hypothetical protein
VFSCRGVLNWQGRENETQEPGCSYLSSRVPKPDVKLNCYLLNAADQYNLYDGSLEPRGSLNSSQGQQHSENKNPSIPCEVGNGFVCARDVLFNCSSIERFLGGLN